MKKATKKVQPIKPQPIEQLDLATVDFDLTKFPWPYADGSVKTITCAHKMEYIPAKLRIPFMEEAWRVLEDAGTMTVIVCYWTSLRAIQDPALEWPPFCEQSFLYFNNPWRTQNQLPAVKCNFEFPGTYGYSADAETSAKNQETQTFWIKHYVNTALDVQLTLTKRGLS